MDQKGNLDWLRKEVTDWKSKGIITEYQEKQILSQYGLEVPSEPERVEKEKEKGKGTSKLIPVVSVLGSVLIGIGAILYVASNWGRIPDPVKLILLVGTTFSVYYIGWRLKYETKSHPQVGHALLFLGCLLVGATIFLTAQIFHVEANAHWLLLLWFVAISPLGYAFNSKPILGLNIVTLAFWMFFYVADMNVRMIVVFMLYSLFGISLYGLGQLHTRIKEYTDFRLIYQGGGLLLILASYFYFSIAVPYERIFGEIPMSWTLQLLFSLFGITALISVGYSALQYGKLKQVKYEFYILLLAFVGWVAIFLLSTVFNDAITASVTTDYGYTYVRVTPGVALVLSVVFNALFFVLALGSVLLGYYKGTTPFVNTGMFFFVLGILYLYFTTIYRLLPRALAFIAGGLILLGMGWYLEKKRRSLIKDIEVRDHE